MGSRKSWLRFVIPPVCAIGILLNVWIACNVFLRNAWLGRNDFLGFYEGARMVGTPQLYDREAVRELQLQTLGETFEIPYPRLPCYAWFLKPLGSLPYRTSYTLWIALMSSAFAGFIALWPGVTDARRWMICCWSLPAFISLFNGQDDLLLLFWAAVGACLLRAGKPFAAGIALALCFSKFHLVGLVPVVILAQRRWRMAGGLATGLAGLLALSFAAAGWNWPLKWYAVLADERINPGLKHMPNLHSLFTPLGPLSLPMQIAGGAVLVIGLFLAARRASGFEQPLALALVAGLLAGFHGYMADGALLPPALMVFSAKGYARLPAIALVTPVPWFFLQLPNPLTAISQVLIVAFAAAGLAWIGVRSKRPPAISGAPTLQVSR